MSEIPAKRRFVFPPQAWAVFSAGALLAMELTVLSLWYRVFFYTTRATTGQISLVLGVVLVGSYLLAQSLNRWQRPLMERQGALAAWLLLAAFGSLRLLLYAKLAVTLPELLNSPLRFIFTAGADAAGFFHVLAVALLIWHGVVLARAPLSLLSAQVSFQIGLIWMLLYGMAFAPSRPVEASLGLYAFLFFGLISMSAARVAGLTDLRGGRLPRFGLTWLGGIAAAAMAVVALSLVLGWVAGTQLVALVVRAFVFLTGFIVGIVMTLLLPFLLALSQLLMRLVDMIREVLARLSFLQMPGFVQDIAEGLENIVQAIVPAVLAVRGMTLAIILAVVLVAVLLALRFRPRAALATMEEDTSTSHAEPTAGLLRHWLTRLAEQGRHLRLRTPGQLLAAARIRQIYRQLMALSQKLGTPRPASVTPLEFTPRLVPLFPEHHAELDEITGAYVRVRYGEYPETMAEVETVQAAWERVRRQGRTIMAQKKAKK